MVSRGPCRPRELIYSFRLAGLVAPSSCCSSAQSCVSKPCEDDCETESDRTRPHWGTRFADDNRHSRINYHLHGGPKSKDERYEHCILRDGHDSSPGCIAAGSDELARGAIVPWVNTGQPPHPGPASDGKPD